MFLQMLQNKIVLLLGLFLMLLLKPASALCIETKDSSGVEVLKISGDTVFLQSNFSETDSLRHHKNSAKENKKKKIVAAVFAFPFPFGFMGAHRVMLGTSPWVPIVYVATFGGCFGLLPLIDFCVITFSKDIEQYENNPHIFMWVK
jgi:TM2 domain-containing membrane protein YozV